MAAATPEELGDDLDGDLAWRRSELQVLRSEVEKIGNGAQGTPRARALLRASVALLYAHWEGFARHSCQAYLDYVAQRRLPVRELSDDFVLLALRRAVRQADSDPQRVTGVLDFVRNGEHRPAIPRRDVVDTASNLRHLVLKRMLGDLGLPSSDFELKAQLIDRSLCDARNDIAHWS